ncbi:MAG: hypothetical protein JWO22_3443, partial [Frankiales bacterium]|nr:hypothetical protein [Frankiales bacterium]
RGAAPRKTPPRRAPRVPGLPVEPEATSAPAAAATAKASAKRAPATRVPATRIPAKRAPAKAVKKVPVSDLGGSATPGPWPVSQAPSAARSAVVVPVPAAPASLAAEPVATPAPRESDGLVRFLVLLAVLLLAAAAGMGAAAFVEHRDSTFKASTVVRLDAGPDPALPIEDTLSQGVTTYVAAASDHAFTLTSEQRAGVAPAAVQGDVQAVQRAPRQITLSVLAKTSGEARALATGAGDAFVELVNLQETVNQASAGDRLAAVVVGPQDGVVKTAPKARDAWIAALLAAGAVLVLAGVGTLLRLTRRS